MVGSRSFSRIGAFSALVIVSLLFLNTAARAQQQIGITINGSPVNVYPEPIMRDGRVFVPLRGVFENLGASVVYSNGNIDATSGNTEISLQIGSTQASVNGSQVTIDVAPFIVGASTFVPLRFVSQALGATVDWDDANQVVAITAPYNNNGENYNNDNYVSEAPPPIPDYEPPPVPDPNYIWTPGYWAWGPAGYYWVPGTWVPAPQPGLLWTPGYWAWQAGAFIWHAGYWSDQVGFYGGVNYGGGYYGNGFAGGMWRNNQFRYNTAVVRVTNPTVIRNVYVDKSVVRNTANHVSYNGGPHGVAATPTAAQRTIASKHHVPMTAVQQQHARVASQDRQLLAKVNAGHPPIVAAAKPFTPASKPAGFVPVTSADHVAPARPARTQAPVARPVHTRAPAARPVHTRAPMRPQQAPHTQAPVARPAHTRAPMRPQQAPHTQAPVARPAHTQAPRPERPAQAPMRPQQVPHTQAPVARSAHTQAPRPERPAQAPMRPQQAPHTQAPRPERTEQPRPHATERPTPQP